MGACSQRAFCIIIFIHHSQSKLLKLRKSRIHDLLSGVVKINRHLIVSRSRLQVCHKAFSILYMPDAVPDIIVRLTALYRFGSLEIPNAPNDPVPADARYDFFGAEMVREDLSATTG